MYLNNHKSTTPDPQKSATIDGLRDDDFASHLGRPGLATRIKGLSAVVAEWLLIIRLSLLRLYYRYVDSGHMGVLDFS